MYSVLVVIPKASDEDISPIVFGGISSQLGCDIEIMVESQPRLLNVNREVSINNCRHKLQERVKSRLKKFDFVLLLDSDVVMESNGVVQSLIHSLERWKKSAHAVTKGIVTSHMCAACCLVDWFTYLRIDYTKNPEECQCRKLQAIVGRKQQEFIDPKKYRCYELQKPIFNPN